MIDLLDFLDSVEKLAYKILLWVILIPKTLWRIITNPEWVPLYINRELKQEKSSFDEYVSPIILLLVVALIPTLIIFILPEFNVTISSPSETEPTAERTLTFNAEATFISGSNNVRDQYRWHVEKLDTDETGQFIYDQDGYPSSSEIYGESYNEFTNRTDVTVEGITTELDSQLNTNLTRNQNSSSDEFIYHFDGPGAYFVIVEAIRSNTNRNDIPLEQYVDPDGTSAYMYVYVPSNPEDSISIKNYAPKQQRLQWADVFSDKSTIIIIALLLLTPPLVAAFTMKILTREKVSENSLTENFYVQCYYFAPLSLTLWATFYGAHYYTIDIFFYRGGYELLILVPLILAGFWFVYAETYATALALRTSGWQALIIVVGCILIFVIGITIILIVTSVDLRDNLRKGMILAYPFGLYLILVGILAVRLLGWLFARKKLSVGDVLLLIAFFPSTFVFLGGNMLAMIVGPDKPTPTVSSSSVVPINYTGDTPVSLIATPTFFLPTETSMPLPSPTSAANPGTYVMHQGEFPYCLARRFNVNPAQLLALNGLADGQNIPAGAALRIPQDGNPFPGNRTLLNHPAIYMVPSSDKTLYSIACLFGDVYPEAIARANGIATDATLSIGQQLQIP